MAYGRSRGRRGRSRGRKGGVKLVTVYPRNGVYVRIARHGGKRR